MSCGPLPGTRLRGPSLQPLSEEPPYSPFSRAFLYSLCSPSHETLWIPLTSPSQEPFYGFLSHFYVSHPTRDPLISDLKPHMVYKLTFLHFEIKRMNENLQTDLNHKLGYKLWVCDYPHHTGGLLVGLSVGPSVWLVCICSSVFILCIFNTEHTRDRLTCWSLSQQLKKRSFRRAVDGSCPSPHPTGRAG